LLKHPLLALLTSPPHQQVFRVTLCLPSECWTAAGNSRRRRKGRLEEPLALPASRLYPLAGLLSALLSKRLARLLTRAPPVVSISARASSILPTSRVPWWRLKDLTADTSMALVALTFKIPSSQGAETVQSDKALLARVTPNMFVMEGAVPLMVGSEVIGAIGASGAAGGDQDEVCAMAGYNKIKERLK